VERIAGGREGGGRQVPEGEALGVFAVSITSQHNLLGKETEMIGKLIQVLRNEEGIETLEWIAMAFVIVTLVILVAYPGALPGVINTVATNIQTAL
jgi:hypothetical protein